MNSARLRLFTLSVIMFSCFPGLHAAAKTGTSKAVYRSDSLPGYPSYFNQVISSSQSKAASGQFSQAARIFVQEKSGVIPLDFEYDSFLKEGHSSAVRTEIQDIKDGIKKGINEYIALQDKFDSYKKNLSATLGSKNPAQILSEYRKIEPSVKSLLELRNRIYDLGLRAESVFTGEQKKGLARDGGHLSCLYMFILGNGRNEYTGLTGVMDAQLFQFAEAHSSTLYAQEQDLVKKLSVQLKALYPPAYPFKPDAVRAQCTQIEQLYAVMDGLIQTDAGRTGAKKPSQQDEEYQVSVKALSLITERTEELLDLTETAVKSVFDAEDFIDKSVADIAQDLRDKKDDTSTVFVRQSNELLEYGNKASKMKEEEWISSLKKLSSASLRWTEFTAEFSASCDSLDRYCSAKSLSVLKIAGERLVDASKHMYSEDSERLQVMRGLIPDQSDSGAQHYPSRLLSSVTTFRQSISLDVNTLKAASSTLDGGSQVHRSAIQSMQKRIGDSITSIEKLNDQTTALAEQARAQQREAQQAQNQVDIYYNRALAAYRRGDMGSSRQNLDRALALYDASISSLSRDSGIKEEVYGRLSALKQDIAEKQNPLLVQELRVYKTNAKNAYYAGNFDEAAMQLAEAGEVRENWSKFMDVELAPDEELDRLNNLVNTALSIKSGKELNPNDALYPEMSQILSISNQYYSIAQELLEQGKRSEAEAYLSMAKDKLNEFRIIYPRNQQANLLSMRIDQVLDINQFNEAFKIRFEELKQVNYSLRDSAAQVAYSDMQDLYELEPDYPGLRTFMNQAEISLGIRQQPADNSSLDEARALAEQAYSQLSQAERDTIKLESARSLANRALALDPNNDLAVSVLDEVALRTGTSAAVILSARDEERYQQAITYLQNGNIVAANSSLQELLQTPANRRSAKVQKLQSRIQGMLN